MIGKGVLLECLDHERVEKVLVVNRSSLGMSHPKLKEIILKDFQRIGELKEELKGYDACYFCLGVSALGMDEEKYSAITFDITKSFADVLYEVNPQMTFNYVSGEGTDSTEASSMMWARVKGKTENYVLNKGFAKATMFRPGGIIPEKGIKSSTGWYSIIYTLISPFYPLIKKMDSVTTTTKLGLAMIVSSFVDLSKRHVTNSDINKIASRIEEL